MLSILIPTYNYSVLDLVNEIHKQALETSIIFEIIVVDDCSTQISVIENNQQIEKTSNCTLIINKKNLGRTATRNLLANKASFDLLLFLDADVIPKYNDFIGRFQLNNNTDFNLIYGGVCYYETRPEKHKILRWKYGIKRETKSIVQRNKEPYFIISQNLLVKKELFFKLNALETNVYGLDILFSNNLKTSHIKVKHIDNPVYHLGLESSNVFIEKSLKAVKTTFQLEENGLITNDLRPLQQSYLKLKKAKMLGLFSFFISRFKKKMIANFKSSNPNLFWFDLYRLNYFIELKLNKKGV